jgi:hypothetical protein
MKKLESKTPILQKVVNGQREEWMVSERNPSK